MQSRQKVDDDNGRHQQHDVDCWQGVTTLCHKGSERKNAQPE